MLSSSEGDQAAQFLYQPHHQRHQAPAMRHPAFNEILQFPHYNRHGIGSDNRQARNHGNLQIRQDHGYPRYQSEQPPYYNNNPQRHAGIR